MQTWVGLPSLEERTPGALPVLSLHRGVSSINYTLSSYPHFPDVITEAPKSYASKVTQVMLGSLILMPEALKQVIRVF